MFPLVVKAKNVPFKPKKEPDSDTLSHLIQILNFFDAMVSFSKLTVALEGFLVQILDIIDSTVISSAIDF